MFAVHHIPLRLIRTPAQIPRTEFDDQSLCDLANSIKLHGVWQPIVITPQTSDGFYDLICGSRRLQSARLVCLDSIPCFIRDLQIHEAIAANLFENLQHTELLPLEEAKAYRTLIDDYSYTQEQLAEKISKNRATIANALRLLTLTPFVQEALSSNKISTSHAKALCALTTEPEQEKITQLVISKGLSSKQTEELIKRYKKQQEEQQNEAPASNPEMDPVMADLRYICDQFKGFLGTKVKISGNHEKGKIEINYYSSDDLERIAEIILGNQI